MFDFSIITSWVHGMLTSLMPLGLAVFVECVVGGLCLLLMYAVIAVVMIFMERKVCAAFQCRLGPVRVGFWGLLQVPADVLKMLTKEIITIRRSDRFLYNLAPYIVILASVLAFACLPVSKGLEVLDFNVGVFFLMAASSIGVVGILLAGWSSNNKYSLIGAGALILILFGALVGTYGLFDIIIHGYKRKERKKYAIVLICTLLLILGGFLICWNI